ncbi:nucleotidyltransferase domain-containing protein [Paracoccus sp. p4-l81]|uniref:nucleotidyltransferase domain-containing protein n=1 Tax=Paracoccus sp. p4-l81 TaxID=3342806 RepID=UPI0035B8D5E7
MRCHDPIPPAIRTRIDAELAAIRATGVRILFAVESGSRAWGFPSPDSDYDVRFVYHHPRDWYLSLVPGRDVIERPISDELDISGWDLRKALNLLLKPNPTLLEWLSSPIRYAWDDAACAGLRDLAARIGHRAACAHHYRQLALGQWRQHIDGQDHVAIKKYFYVLRPALALRWLRMRGDLVPMRLQDLMAGTDLPAPLAGAITDLVALKAQTREMGKGARLPDLDALILSELHHPHPDAPRAADHLAQATDLFRRLIG